MSIKVFELAKELDVPAKELNVIVNRLGIPSKDNFTILTEEQVKKVKKAISNHAPEASVTPAAAAGAPKIKRRISAKAPHETPIKVKKRKDESHEETHEEEEVVAEVEEVTPAPEETPAPAPVVEIEPVVEPEIEVVVAPAVGSPKKEELTLEERKARDHKHKKDLEEAEAKRKKLLSAKKAHTTKKDLLRDLDEESAVDEEEIPLIPKEEEEEEKDKAAQNRITRWTKPLGRPGRKDAKGKKKAQKASKHIFNARKKDLVVGQNISVGDLASLIGVKAPEILKTLFKMGIMATINQVIDGETAALIASDHEVELKVEIKSIEDSLRLEVDKDEDKEPRPPVVTIMGHVDHGKTSLLDRIRKTSIAAGEAGGITQHIGAYMVSIPEGEICFLDTPGHEAFTAMRARGANATDIVILVVAADDGPKPQTVEAIHHAKAAGVPIIVAINKCDKPGANPQKVVQQLMEHELISEEFGGETAMIPVSAHTGEGIPKLLEMISLQAEMMELKANPNRLAEGVVIESKVEKGKGNVATILIQKGTLKNGDNYVVGTEFGRVRAMWDDKGRKLKEATPSMPIELVGLNGLPKSGDAFTVGPDEKTVRQIAESRAVREKQDKIDKQTAVSLETLFANAAQGEKKTLNLIVKTDVVGSMEALTDSLRKLGNDEVQVNIIHSAVGGIARGDVVLAAASKAIIIGFNTRPDNASKQMAQEEGLEIRIYSVIYEAIDDVTRALEGMLQPVVREEILGRAEVLEVFNIPKVGVIAGCKVIDGKFVRDCPVRVIRDNIMIHDGQLASLKRFKDDAREVTEGFECGIGIRSYKDLKAGDILESYTRTETKAKL